jgi:fructokinase
MPVNDSEMASLPPREVSNTIICFGELLWDILPAGRFLGGAPANVAFHLQQLGFDPRIISAVGDDALGTELLSNLSHWKLEVGGISRRVGWQTGTVQARLSKRGDARYDIVDGVAWDVIKLDESSATQIGDARAVVFGSLAQRSVVNRTSLGKLLVALPNTAERVFDVNLRPPFDDLRRVRELARHATVLKLNAEEAARLVSDSGEIPGDEEHDARCLAEQFRCTAVCITSGARGAGLFTRERWYWEPGRPVVVADTVGAGDAFLAAFLGARLRREEPAACLAEVCRLGEWVASQSGATPRHLNIGPS